MPATAAALAPYPTRSTWSALSVVDSAVMAPSMPWSDPTIRFRLGVAWSMVSTAVRPMVGVK